MDLPAPFIPRIPVTPPDIPRETPPRAFILPYDFETLSNIITGVFSLGFQASAVDLPSWLTSGIILWSPPEKRPYLLVDRLLNH